MPYFDADFDLPAPQKSKKGLWVILTLVLVLAGSSSWIAYQMASKGEISVPLPDAMAQKISAFLGLPDGRLGPLRFGPAEQPEQLVMNLPGVTDLPPADALETSSGPTAHGQVVMENTADSAAPPIRPKQDNMVTPAFVEDLAIYLAGQYWPKGAHPSAQNGPACTASIKSLNQRYGLDLLGLGNGTASANRNFERDRAQVLDYVMMPSMLKALSNIYQASFVDKLAEAATKPDLPPGRQRSLTPGESSAMLAYYAAEAKKLGSALNTYAASEVPAQNMANYLKAEREVNQVSVRYLEAASDLEVAREGKEEGRLSVSRAQRELEAAGKEYKSFLLNREKAKEAVVFALSRGEGARLDPESCLYVAAWAYRRGPSAIPALRAAAQELNALAEALVARSKFPQ